MISRPALLAQSPNVDPPFVLRAELMLHAWFTLAKGETNTLPFFSSPSDSTCRSRFASGATLNSESPAMTTERRPNIPLLAHLRKALSFCSSTRPSLGGLDLFRSVASCHDSSKVVETASSVAVDEAMRSW